MWLELTSFVLTAYVGICTCVFGTTVHRQKCRLGKKGLAGFSQKHTKGRSSISSLQGHGQAEREQLCL